MSSSTPIKNKRIPITKGRVAGFLNWGSDNLFPQKWLEVVRSSSTTSRCLGVQSRFIEGNGLLDTALSRMVVHRSGLRLDQLLSRTSKTASNFEGIAWHISYNGELKISGVRPVSYEIARLTEPDDLGYISHAGLFPYLGSTLYPRRAGEHARLPLFNPDPEVVLAQIQQAGGIAQYEGQLFYEPFLEDGDEYYHTPNYFSAEKDVQSDTELSEYDYRSIVNGFNSAGMLKILDMTDPAEGYDPMSDPNSIESQLAQGQGTENTSNIIVHRGKSKEELDAMRFESFADPKLADRYGATADRVAIRISRATMVPAVLANIFQGSSIFPDATALETASNFMQLQVNPIQRHISDALMRVFAHWKTPIQSDFAIQNLDYFNSKKQATQAG